MSERLNGVEDNTFSPKITGEIGKVTLFEALAENTSAVGIDKSNHTSQAPDYDDQ